MRLEELKLTKEEIPILYDRFFLVPIHPRLLSSDIQLDPQLACKSFEQAAQEWYRDLSQLVTREEIDAATRQRYKELFIPEPPEIIMRYGRQCLKIIDWTGWENDHILQDNGFMRALSISRDFGGSLYFTESDSGCTAVTFGNDMYIRFSREKALAYAKQFREEFIKVSVYSHHNIDEYPGALFLRNWAITYLNSALESIID